MKKPDPKLRAILAAAVEKQQEEARRAQAAERKLQRDAQKTPEGRLHATGQPLIDALHSISHNPKHMGDEEYGFRGRIRIPQEVELWYHQKDQARETPDPHFFADLQQDGKTLALHTRVGKDKTPRGTIPMADLPAEIGKWVVEVAPDYAAPFLNALENQGGNAKVLDLKKQPRSGQKRNL